MKVTVVFFASLRESLGVSSVEFKLTKPCKVSVLILKLADQQSQTWVEKLTEENVRVAVNHELVNEDVIVSNGDEVAFFPPVTGG